MLVDVGDLLTATCSGFLGDVADPMADAADVLLAWVPVKNGANSAAT